MEEEASLEWAAVLSEGTHLDLANLNQAVEKYRYQPNACYCSRICSLLLSPFLYPGLTKSLRGKYMTFMERFHIR